MSEHRQHFRTRPDVRFRAIGGEGVIVRQDAGQAVVVNAVGSRILELLRDGLSAAEVIARLREEYDVGGAELEQEVMLYLDELQAAGVIEAMEP